MRKDKDEFEREKKVKKWKRRFPLSWKECIICGQRVRFEWMWMRPVLFSYSPFGLEYVYICRECAPTREDAADRFDEFLRNLKERSREIVEGVADAIKGS